MTTKLAIAMRDNDDIDLLMADDLDAQCNKLWEQGAREALGDEEFERQYPEMVKNRL